MDYQVNQRLMVRNAAPYDISTNVGCRIAHRHFWLNLNHSRINNHTIQRSVTPALSITSLIGTQPFEADLDFRQPLLWLRMGWVPEGLRWGQSKIIFWTGKLSTKIISALTPASGSRRIKHHTKLSS